MVEKVLNLQKEKTIFWFLTGSLFILMCFYIYFINITVHNVVAKQNFENEAGQLTLAIGNKEFEYISKRNAVNLQLAYSMGFKDAKVSEYVSTKEGKDFAFLAR